MVYDSNFLQQRDRLSMPRIFDLFPQDSHRQWLISSAVRQRLGTLLQCLECSGATRVGSGLFDAARHQYLSVIEGEAVWEFAHRLPTLTYQE